MELKDKLLVDLNQQINWFEKKAKLNRKISFWQRLLTSSLNVLLLVLLGIDYKLNSEYLILISIVISTIIVLLHESENFFKNKELWKLYTNTGSKLRGIRNELNNLIIEGGQTISKSNINTIQEKYDQTLQSNNEIWSTLR